MTDHNPELIAKAADVIDARHHDYRVDHDTWRPYCICGWTAEESYDVAAYDRHLAVAVLEAVADDLRAEGATQAMDDAADEVGKVREAIRLAQGVIAPPHVAMILAGYDQAEGVIREQAAKLRGRP